MARQVSGSCGLVSLEQVRAGKEAVARQLAVLREQNKRYTVLDAMTDDDLRVLAEALPDDVLLTGGSGLAGALAALGSRPQESEAISVPDAQGKCPVLAGSSSSMTNRQVAFIASTRPHRLSMSSVPCTTERPILKSWWRGIWRSPPRLHRSFTLLAPPMR